MTADNGMRQDAWDGDPPTTSSGRRARELAERMEFLQAVPVLSDLAVASIRALAGACEERTFLPGWTAVAVGATLDAPLIVVRGEAWVTEPTPSGELQRTGILQPGELFGCDEALSGSACSQQLRAGLADPLTVYAVRPDAFRQIVAPQLRRNSQRHERAQLADRMGRLDVFAHLDSRERLRVAAALTPRRAVPGEILVREGEPAREFFVLLSGSVCVTRANVPVARLGPGSFFGETAMLFTAKRTATVTAETDLELWTMERLDFEELVRDQLLRHEDLRPVVLERLPE